MSELADYIHAKDVQQADPKTARVCAKNAAHGRLTTHGTGGGLVCGAILGKGKDGFVHCDYVEPLGRG